MMTANLTPVPIPDDELLKLRQMALHELRDIPGSTATIRPEFEPGEMLWLLEQVEQARRLRKTLAATKPALPEMPSPTNHEPAPTFECCRTCSAECRTSYPSCMATLGFEGDGPTFDAALDQWVCLDLAGAEHYADTRAGVLAAVSATNEAAAKNGEALTDPAPTFCYRLTAPACRLSACIAQAGVRDADRCDAQAGECNRECRTAYPACMATMAGGLEDENGR